MVKESNTQGFQSNFLSDIVSNAAYTPSQNNTAEIRLSSYTTIRNPEPAIYQQYSPLVNYNYMNDSFSKILDTINKYDTFLSPQLEKEVLGNISNGIMNWCWSWYNSSSGYFRNDIKETASVVQLYPKLAPYLNNKSKIYFYDVITALNTTVDQYTYSRVENTTGEINVVTTQLS